jgi:hypothetical protein
MGLLSKDQILTADDLPSEDVDVPQWGGTVRLRGLTGTERDAYEVSMIKAREGNLEANLQNVRAGLIAKCIVGEDGQRLFTDGEVKRLGMKAGVVLDRLFAVASRLSGLSRSDVDELAGNLDEDRSESSTSDSPSPSDAPSENSSTVSTLAS